MIDQMISKSLSGKVLILAITFVMIAEVLIFIPSAAIYRQNWLGDRAERAGHLTLALMGVPDYEGSEILSAQFMEDTDVIMLSTKREGMTELVLGSPPDTGPFDVIDIRGADRFPAVLDTFKDFFGSEDGYLRVISTPLMDGQDSLEYIVPRASLKQALQDYCHRILLLSLLIAVFTGLMLYGALSLVVVRPIKDLAAGLGAFREDPETRRSNLPPSSRKDEIGQLQREFYDMKQSVRQAFKQQDRLATLGLAVAKINHDLRNVLTSAQLVSDRIAMDKDERVAHMGERLVRAVDRGIKLCADVLNFSQSKDDPPDYEPIRISLLLGEAAADVLPSFGTGRRAIRFNNDVPTDLSVSADPDHTYRIFLNLFRNAAQVMAGLRDDAAIRELSVRAEPAGEHTRITVSDTGQGLPEKAKANLFKAFASTSGHGSTGLGLTISRELARDQGGDLVLTETGENGTTFAVTLNASPNES